MMNQPTHSLTLNSTEFNWINLKTKPTKKSFDALETFFDFLDLFSHFCDVHTHTHTHTHTPNLNPLFLVQSFHNRLLIIDWISSWLGIMFCLCVCVCVCVCVSQVCQVCQVCNVCKVCSQRVGRPWGHDVTDDVISPWPNHGPPCALSLLTPPPFSAPWSSAELWTASVAPNSQKRWISTHTHTHTRPTRDGPGGHRCSSAARFHWFESP